MKKIPIFLSVLLALGAAIPVSTCHAAKLIKPEASLMGLKNAYAPSVMQFQGYKRMWFSGWVGAKETGPDKIYSSVYKEGKWSAPQPLVWNKDPRNRFAFNNGVIVNGLKPGYGINTPSVISVTPNRLFMYYTALPNNSVSLKEHTLGLAISGDGGATWWDQGIILKAATGIWAPSALIAGNEIWVYYHSAELKLYRQKLELNGKTKIGLPETVVIENNTILSFVDVSVFNSKFIMVANTSDVRSIVKYESDDGLHFKTSANDRNPIISVGFSLRYVLAPRLQYIDSTHYKIFFAYSEFNRFKFDSIHEWTYKDVQ